MTRSFQQTLTACFGSPVAENPTQAMMEAAYRHHRLDWRYLTIEVASGGLADAVRGARAMGFVGFNCTIPHKLAVIEHLDGLADSARAIGAVNCVTRRDDRLIGENTDGRGFLESLRTLRDPGGLSFAILGAGGAARAIGVELILAGARQIRVINRSPRRGEELAAHLDALPGASASFEPWEGDYAIPEDVDALVQATSIGLYPDVSARVPIVESSLRPGLIVADVIPNPPETRLLRDAARRGCLALDGLGMLINQGALGLQSWAGLAADRAVMRRALEAVWIA